MGKLISLPDNFFFPCLFIALVFSYCTPNKDYLDVDYPIVEFDKAISKEAHLSEYTDSLKYTFLEYDSENLVGKILIFKVTKNHIILVDQQQKLFVFNKKGDLVTFIYNKGEGPSEYNSIEDFAVDSEEEHIVVLDSRRGKLLKFDFSGSFIESYPIDYTHAAHISALENGNYAIFQSARFSIENHCIFLLDQHFHKVDSIVDPLGSFLKEVPYLLTTHWYDYNNSVLYKEALADTVFRVSGSNKLEPHVLFNLGKKRMPDEYYTQTSSYQQHAHKYYLVADIFESNKYIFIHVMHDGQDKYFVFNKNSSFLHDLGSNALLIPTGQTNFEFWPQYLSQETLYRFIDAQELSQRLQKNHSPKADKIMKILQVNDNPVLLSSELLPKSP